MADKITIEQIEQAIYNLQKVLLDNPTDIVEYTVSGRTVKRNRQEVRDEINYWKKELDNLNKPKRKILTRF